MLCSLKMETEYSCCNLGRKSLPWYGFIKIIINILIACGIIYQVGWFPYFAMIVYSCVAALFIVDIVFQSILIIAVHRKTEQNLLIYYKYTKVLWWIVVVVGVIYTIAYLEFIPRDLARFSNEMDDLFGVYIAVMFIGAFIQWIMWHKLMKPNAADELKQRFFKFNFSVQSGPVSTTKDVKNTKKEEYDNDAVEEIVITNENAKLTE